MDVTNIKNPAPAPAAAGLWLKDRRVQEFLWYCAPALVIGMALRTWLMACIPYGYVQGDTPDFLYTAYRFTSEFGLVLHHKKTFLTPILYTLPFLAHVNVLITIAAAQHLLGLLLIVLTGALVRIWFGLWRWFLIPVTLLTAINPMLMWYEQALMAETHYLFCVLCVALAGSWYAAERTRGSLIALLIALFFTAGSRPEGKLFFAFGLLLVILERWGSWKQLLAAVAAVGLVGIGTAAITRTGQAGVLLYATVLPLAPETPKSAPDFATWIRPLREQMREQSEVDPVHLNHVEREVSDVTEKYLKSKGLPASSEAQSKFCAKLAVEACLRRPLLLPVIAKNKFLATMKGLSSAGFDSYTLYDWQTKSFFYRDWFIKLARPLTGSDLRTEEEVRAFFERHEHPPDPDWFEALRGAWKKVTLDFRGADKHYGKERVPGLPYFYVMGLAGMFAALVRPGTFHRLQICWLLTLAGLWFAVMLTGVVNSRYRFIFEPFFLLYAFFLLDSLFCGMRWLRFKRCVKI